MKGLLKNSTNDLQQKVDALFLEIRWNSYVNSITTEKEKPAYIQELIDDAKKRCFSN
jgi:hypothetical protein